MNRAEESIHRHEIAFRGKEIFVNRAKPHIIVCGAGALGSNAINILARQGFTNISVIDKDKVEAHNTANQLFGKSDVGAAKVRALATKMQREVGVKINPVQKELNASNAKKLFKDADLIVDTFDNFDSRRVVSDTAAELGIPCIHAGMSDDGFSEVKWNRFYKIPEVEVKQEDVCEYPLAVNLVHFTVGLLVEVIVRYVDEHKRVNIDFTLNDLKVTRREM